MFFELKKDVFELLDVHRRFRINNSVEIADFESFLLIVPGQGMDSSIQETLLSTEVEQKGDLKGRIFEESKKIWRVALPSIVSRVTSFGTIVVTQSFVGHISSVDLAGYALVQTLSVRFVNGIVIGMSSATETLCGQAFGAKQYHMMGIFLQRSWLVDLTALTVLLPVFIFATPIFNLLGEEKAIAKSAGHISLWFILFLYSIVFSTTIQMYLQAQQKNMVIAWLSVTQFAIHIPLSWLFVYVLNWGLDGAMAALCISSWFLVLGEFVYIFGGWCPDSWKGFSLAALKDIFPVVKLSISSGVMVCLELWYYAILVLLAGYMKNAEVAISAFSISVRIANELGRGDAKATKFSIKVLMATSVIIGLFFWILCLAFGNKLGYLFTNEEEVAQTVSDLSLLLAFSVLLNGIYPVLSGVAVGAGLQTKVAIINLVCFYIIGLPIGAVLGYVFQLQVKGIWIGMISGVVTETLALSFMAWRTNWDQEVSITSARLKRWYLKSAEESKQSSDHS
ncbi:UNVERIFIED_CONTAM: protein DETOXIFICATION 24 [Sesamum calycinum]|uniref:Protein DETOXIFICATION n=1 Tax=Sesamum calycinum TaxID=2727403 RepID=A0AAW2RTG9_9LAMI